MSLVLKADEFEALDQKIREILTWQEIRFVGLINNQGRLVLGGFKEGVEPFVDDADMQKMHMELALRVSMRRDFDYSLGPVLFSASRRQNTVMFSFPIHSRVMVVSADTSVDIEKFASKILDKLNERLTLKAEKT